MFINVLHELFGQTTYIDPVDAGLPTAAAPNPSTMKHNMLQYHASSFTYKDTHDDTCLSISVSVSSFADALFFLSTYESYNNFIFDPFSYGRFLFLTSLYSTCSRFYTFSSIFISLDTFLFPSALFRTFL